MNYTQIYSLNIGRIHNIEQDRVQYLEKNILIITFPMNHQKRFQKSFEAASVEEHKIQRYFYT